MRVRNTGYLGTTVLLFKCVQGGPMSMIGKYWFNRKATHNNVFTALADKFISIEKCSLSITTFTNRMILLAGVNYKRARQKKLASFR